jgi:neutral trehalase
MYGALGLGLMVFLVTHNGVLVSGACTSRIYCQGPILDMIQRSGIFKDSKTFVDMPTNVPEDVVLKNFQELPHNATRVELDEFIYKHFDTAGSDLETPIPVDWHEDIALLKNIDDAAMRKWVLEIHSIWKQLLRRYNSSKLCPGCVSSSLPVEHPFIIPGGRFREFYYWDSYWILEGLLISEMLETAKGTLLNLLSIVRNHGFVPNGSRIYYLERSQPPFLTQMMKTYYDRTGDLETLTSNIELLDTEYLFWMRERSISLTPNQDENHSSKYTYVVPAPYDSKQVFSETHVQGTLNKKHLLNVYYVRNTGPRPESYKEDYMLAQTFQTDAERVAFYQNVASAAESGWDFSSRWMHQVLVEEMYQNELNATSGRLKGNERTISSFGLRDMDIIHLIPLDLNALLYSNERTLEWFYRLLGSKKRKNIEHANNMADFYARSAMRRYDAMKSVLWDAENQQWSDFNLTSENLQSTLQNKNANQQEHSNCSKLEHPKETAAKEWGEPYRKSGRFYVSDFSVLWYFNDITNERSLESASNPDILPESDSSNSQLEVGRENRDPSHNQSYFTSSLSVPVNCDFSPLNQQAEPSIHTCDTIEQDLSNILDLTFKDMIKRIFPENYSKALLSPKSTLNSSFHLSESALDALIPPSSASIWDYPGGIPTSGVSSRQQWDFPNAWAPFQYYIVDSLLRQSQKAVRIDAEAHKAPIYRKWALQVATRWVHSTFCGWNRTQQFYEKYNVMYSGVPGEGGEYLVQEGFGWTNAVILMLLEKFPNEIHLPAQCIAPPPPGHGMMPPSFIIAVQPEDAEKR